MPLDQMDGDHYTHRLRRFPQWLKRKFKREDPFPWDSDAEEENSNDDYYEGYTGSMDMGASILTNELRIFVGTWNVAGRSPVGSLAVDLDDWLNLNEAADIYVLGFQEIVPLKTVTVIGTEDKTPATKWNTLIGKTLKDKFACPWAMPLFRPTSTAYYHQDSLCSERRDNNKTGSPMRDERYQKDELHRSSYMLIASKKLVGIFISVWVKKDLLRKYYISRVTVCAVGCGIMGYLGNKGAVSASMCIEGTNFCFVVAHLASGEKKGDEVRRNYQVSEIFRRTVFPRNFHDDDYFHPNNILGHDKIFWFGDLNYRLFSEDTLARQLIKKEDWKALQEFDQLKNEQDHGIFHGWKEGDIEFAPTYKYSFSNCDRYSGGLPSRTGEKQRTPAWCDRILWYGKGVKQLSYLRSESKFSDHRPVSALFTTQIEVVGYINPGITALPNLAILPNQRSDTSSNNTLLSLMVRDTEEPMR